MASRGLWLWMLLLLWGSVTAPHWSWLDGCLGRLDHSGVCVPSSQLYIFRPKAARVLEAPCHHGSVQGDRGLCMLPTCLQGPSWGHLSLCLSLNVIWHLGDFFPPFPQCGLFVSLVPATSHTGLWCPPPFFKVCLLPFPRMRPDAINPRGPQCLVYSGYLVRSHRSVPKYTMYILKRAENLEWMKNTMEATEHLLFLWSYVWSISIFIIFL